MALVHAKQVKVVILGDSGVGKSSIMLRYVAGNFLEESEPTLGGAFMAKQVQYKGKHIKYQIWDTAGQEKYHSLAPMYYRDAQIAILVFDITNKYSFESLKKWVSQLKENGPKDLMICVLGNKVDLIEHQQVPDDEANKFAKDLGSIFKLCSAKQDRGIKDLFDEIGEEIWRKEAVEEERQTVLLTETNKKEKSDKGGCCSK